MTQQTQTVLIGVTGCIAAYKSCEIVRGLQKAGLRVKVVMTPHATEFVGPTTFRGLTREPVAVDLFDNPSAPIHHVSLAQEADLFLIAPCTANVLAKVAHGLADDLLTTTALACTAPLMIAPAMNVNMYEAPATQQNMRILRERGVRFVDAEAGYLACGDVGKGRLADPEVIVAAVLKELGRARDLEGRRIMVTAGPTQEPLDPVRYLSNCSSGKMGYAVAERALARGAKVSLVTGPVALEPPAGADVVRVQTACQMLDAARAAFADADAGVFTAAVADMRPAAVAERKLKKGGGDVLDRIELVENPDVLATLASERKPGQVVVGFAAETDDVIANAQAKLARKGADLIVANRVGDGLVFGQDQNQAHLVFADHVEDLPLQSKADLADAILDQVSALLG
ncbi:MAG: bifunctional phosphopantothenoylcysteine decarboxylase/phosphopantothenate--cysteine ligase CoaBC [Coriobacteriia bacterium]|nr:bifunctional phosphopantothenoylcysteine decarboxylase/phosphopantothenate--cysteine ligase CoaBC [Coriobacteriia bacterium]